jgi:hypothetical protein
MPSPSQDKGARWRNACERWLQENGWPGAQYVGKGRGHRGDVTGVGDISVDFKDHADWRNLPASIAQCEADAVAKDVPTGVVWQKRTRKPDPGEGYIVQRAVSFWADRQRLAELEAVEAEYARFRERFGVIEEAAG